MSGEHDNIARAACGYDGGRRAPARSDDQRRAVDIAAPAAAAARTHEGAARRLQDLARRRAAAPGEIPGIDVFERDASEVMSRQHTRAPARSPAWRSSSSSR
jgi:hypothetical protein